MDISFFTHLLNALLMIGMPVGLAFFLRRKWNLGWRLWMIGAATFILSQVVHIPFNMLALNKVLVPLSGRFPGLAGDLIVASLLGLSAGLFEELSRAGMFRWWAKDARSWRTGILTGAGHGGIEAILLGCLAFIALMQLTVYRNVDLSTIYKDSSILATARMQVDSYWSATWYDSILGALERAFAISVHIACAVLVLQAFTRRQKGWVALAVIYHAVVDAAAVFTMKLWGPYWSEVLVGVFALISVAIIYALRKPEPASELVGQPVMEGKSPPLIPKEIEETPDQLESSRYV